MQLKSIKVPGRINLIGEHTDYTQGYVLPVAINLFTEFFFEKQKDITIKSNYFDEEFNFELNNLIAILTSGKIEEVKKQIPSSKSDWLNFIFGIMYYFNQIHKILEGFYLTIGTTIPIGSGMSSSASLDIGVIEFLEYHTGHKLDDFTAVKLAKKVENEFIGIQSGFLDPMAIRYGKKNSALFFKCDKKIKVQYIPLSEHYKLLIADTLIRRELKNSNYNQRVTEAKSIQSYVNKELKLSDLTHLNFIELEKIKDKISEAQYLRAKHIISENNRVKEFVKALEINNDNLIFELLYSSHNSLKNNFEVSWPEADFIIESIQESLKGQKIGARMMGGGFGGCVLIVFTDLAVKSIINLIDNTFFSKFNYNLKFYNLKTSEIQYISNIKNEII